MGSRATEQVLVRRHEIRRGDHLHVGHNQHVRVDQVGHGENGVSLIWLEHFYYPVRIENGSLATVTRAVKS